jgi:c-di-GMP-binding flagellar brake protein YcgR
LLINPGTKVKVEVYLTDPPVVFHTSVIRSDIKSIELAAPMVNGKRVGVPSGTRVMVLETSATGLLFIDTRVDEIRTKPQAAWVLPTPGLEGIRKIQRRHEPRYEVDLHLNWRRLSEPGSVETTPLHLVNVNSGGALLSIDKDLGVGEEIIIDLSPLIHVSGALTDRKVSTRARIVRKVGEPSRVYGASFDSLERLEKVHLLEALRRLKSRVV